MRDKIFISYSHKDAPYQLRLRTRLRPFEREGKLNFWVDSKINVGDKWHSEIEKALSETLVAILLVSADFLASDFIMNNELPLLLGACRHEGVKILPVILKPCAFEMFEISEFQCVNDPQQPVCAMDEAGREAVWARLAKSAWAVYESKKCHVFSSEVESIYPEATVDHGEKVELDEEPYEYSANDHESYYENGANEFLNQLLSHPDELMDYYVYTYMHIDVLDFMPKVKDIIDTSPNSCKLLDRISTLFKRHGWEGDGNIRLLWFPPFLDIGVEDTWGTVVWFAKQFNNGQVFIASPVPLDLDRLLKQQ